MSRDDIAAFPFETLPPPAYEPARGRRITFIGGGVIAVSVLVPPFVGLVTAGSELQIDSNGATATVFLISATLVAFALSLFGAALIGRGRRLQVPPALELLRRDCRAPVLFLRSFDDDDLVDPTPRMVPLGDFFPRRYEESLALALKPIGQMITIGRPGDALPLLGAGRVCVPDHVWKEAVGYLRVRASAVVLMVGRSQGIWWEVTSSLESVPLERLLFFFPYVEDTKRRRSFLQRALYFHPANLPLWSGAYRRMEQEREQRYGEFRVRMQPLLAKPLPAMLEDAQFIDFVGNDTPRVLKRARPWWWPITLLTPSMRRMVTDNGRTLQPFLRKFHDPL